MSFANDGPLPNIEQVRAEMRRRAAEREREEGRWRPRDYQRPLWDHLMGGGLRADVVAHRRWGKDDVALNWAHEASKRRPGVYWHMLPEAAQARKAIWTAINPHTGRKRIDEAFPPESVKRKRDQEMYLELHGGSALWQVVGSDNFNSLVGAPPVGIVFSEWGLAKPDAWAFLRPILAENGGWALFIWTPRGRNHATVAFEARERDKNWFTLRSPATKTDVFTAEQLEREKNELISEMGSKEEGEARYRSEYLVDFDAAAPGAYYASLINAAREATPSRVTRVPYDPAVPVDTAWDLGIDDYTAIWFFQQVGREIRAIDYYETSGEGLPAIVREGLQSKPYVYGTHHLPHDVMAREVGSGRSRYETLKGLNLGTIHVGDAMNPEDRVNAARLMIPTTWFDVDRCALGLARLSAYHKRWNKATRSYGGPKHDEASHGADAFGEFAANRRGAATKADDDYESPSVWAG